MPVRLFQRLRQVHLGWLLGGLLLLPLAQSAATWHVMEHLGEPARQAHHEDASLPHGDNCGLCQLAAVVGAGGAMPALPVCVAAPDFGWMPPAAAAAAAWLAPVAVAYRSRAPPRALG
jgi:hypothetical protein